MINLVLDKNIYSLEAIKRTLVKYGDFINADLSQDDKSFIIQFSSSKQEIKEVFVKEFKNSVVDEDIRINIEKDTKTIRDSLYKMALETSIIDEAE